MTLLLGNWPIFHLNTVLERQVELAKPGMAFDLTSMIGMVR